MRGWMAGMAIGLAAADAAAAVAPPPALTLAGHGFTVGGKAAKFDVTPRAQAIALATAALGKPTAQGSHGDCGQGSVIGYAKFKGQFELSFVGGRLSGWTADGAAPRLAKAIGVGATVAQLRKAYPRAGIEPADKVNEIGPGATLDDDTVLNLSGVAPGARVTGMFAGATCLAGI